MKQKTSAASDVKLKRQRRFLLFLPVIVVPFLTFFLWSVGIVGKADAQTKKGTKQSGFNFYLPTAIQAKDSNWNKMQYYAQADKDSAKLRSLINSYGNDSSDVSGVAINTDPKEKLIEDKIAALNKKLHEPTSINPENSSYENEILEPSPAEKQAALQRMQELQAWSNSSSKMSNVSDTEQSDLELNRLDGMLNKVLDIQHPERIQQQSEENKKHVYPVLTKENKANVSLLQSVQDTGIKQQLVVSTDNRFYGLNDSTSNSSTANTIAAEIPEEQVLVNGAIVKLRLLNDVYIRGTLVPKNQLLYGVASLKGERLDIEISSIGYHGQILPVALSVYDMDGQQGLYIPGAITRDVAKQSADQGIETMNFGTYDASLGAQAATAGIQAAKTLIGKKIKLVKVTVRAGYRVMLRDMNDKSY